MAGRVRGAGPSSKRVAANLRRIRREHEITTAALAKRLAALGHPIADTGITKIEKGMRGVDVDDLTALALALEVTPNRLLLPEMDVADGGAHHMFTPGILHKSRQLWAWATGEVPFGYWPASVADTRETRGEQVSFNRENQPHHWVAAVGQGFPGLLNADTGRLQGAAITALSAVVLQAFQAGLSTADIRDAATGAIAAALVHPRLDAADIRIIESDEEFRIEMREPGTGDKPGPGEFVMDIRVPKPQARKDGGEGRQAGERKTG
jgi:transcriptional regulator with XRE-family HTH domain